MSLPIWLNNSQFTDKKTAKHNQIKNFNSLANKKNTDQIVNDKMVTDLLGELQVTMTENAKLQHTNKTLKSTVIELQNKYTSLMESVKSNKSRFELDLNKLQDEIKNNETQLLQNGKKCLQQQKMYIQERSAKYKSKLKYAVAIINDLNNMLVHCSAKPNVSNTETQTEDRQQSHQPQSVNNTQSYTTPQPQPNLESENLLLSEVFFRSKSFCDNEIFFV
ncbi:hypothetical protein NQ318_015359 [Aromia moschata]|uniref:Uncharacterized protein n=1 Tax=Aromia moschata TaxID=1265417 RepID=A0AAV8YM89_9CUCU|nr:hypothetical protein NQ318_015359 [Aromia moschata]